MSLRDTLRTSTILLPPPHYSWFSRNKRFTFFVLAIAVLTPVFLLVVIFLPIIINFLAGDNGAVHKFIQRVGWPAPVVVGVVYTLFSVLIVPAPILAFGVAVFCRKLWIAIVTGYIGSLTAACISFILGRSKMRTSVFERFAETDSFLEVDTVMNSGKAKAWMVVLLRLSPIMSCCKLNYALSLTLIGFPQYFCGSLLGLLPHNFLFVFLSWVSVHAITSIDINSLFINIYINGSVASISIGAVVILANFARKALAIILYPTVPGSPKTLFGAINSNSEGTDDDRTEDTEDIDSFAAEQENLRNSYQMARSR